MTLSEIDSKFSSDLRKIKLNGKIASLLNQSTIDVISQIGIPRIVLGKFIQIAPINRNNSYIIFSKSSISDIYLAIDVFSRSDEIVCISDYNKSKSFFNSNFECFLRTNYSYELFNNDVIRTEKLGSYYTNYQKYAIELEKVIQSNDIRATKEGVWYSIIQEMMLGII